MHVGIDRLRRLLPEPASGGERVDWDAVANQFGFVLPQDYRAFIEGYGPGTLDGSLFIFGPPLAAVESNEAYGWLEVPRSFGWPFPYPPYPEDGGILRWASNDLADDAYWVCRGSDPDNWTVLVFNRGFQRWTSFDGGMADFLVAVLERRIDSPFNSSSFPSSHPTFISQRDELLSLGDLDEQFGPHPHGNEPPGLGFPG